MNEDFIDYNEMVESALRGVVREALERVATFGMSADHHFYIGFRTDFPGVDIPAHLTAQYSDEMTIVLQHQFWDLHVEEDFFSVALSFNKRQETLTIPFAALTAFSDPSVQFGLQFHVGEEIEEGEEPVEEAILSGDESEVTDEGAPRTAEVVTLDAFRKKS